MSSAFLNEFVLVLPLENNQSKQILLVAYIKVK